MGTEFLSPYPPHTHTHGDPHTHGRPGRLRRMYAGGMNSVEILSYVWSFGLLHVSLSGQSSACRNCIYDILLTCCKQKRTDAQCDILATVELQCRYEAVVEKQLNRLGSQFKMFSVKYRHCWRQGLRKFSYSKKHNSLPITRSIRSSVSIR